MPAVRIVLEGQYLPEAVEALREIPHLAVSVESFEEPQKGISWQEVVVIVSIAKTVIDAGKLAKDAAEVLLKWYQEWKNDEEAIEKAVLITSDDKRLLLENAKPAEVAKALETSPDK